MKRIKLLLAMLALVVMLAGVVILGSPFAPPVEGYREIEEIWAIEDARTESAAPLLTALSNHGQRIGYDADYNTFYCPIGIPEDGEWPAIELTAPGAKGVRVCFVDDYTYDWCDEAVREGYSYQLIAYTDTEFAYCDIVFTGLPIISLDAGGAQLTQADTPVAFTMSAPGGGLTANARAHLRGDSTFAVHTEKVSYKVEFTRTQDGNRKAYEDVPGVGATQDLVLLAMPFDPTMMNDRLCWDVIAAIQGEDEPFQALKCSYVELFIDDVYEGVYLMFVPFDVEREIADAGGAATDRLYRTCIPDANRDRPMVVDEASGVGYELFYAPQEQGAFDALERYLDIVHEEDDDAFAQKALAALDMDSTMRYTALLQGLCLVDNVINNMYIWAHGAPGSEKLRFLPWDLDYSWSRDPGPNWDYWYVMPVADRLLRIDAPGAREALARQWQLQRERALSVERVGEMTGQYVHELNDSGAFRRNAERWNLDAAWAENSQILLLTQRRIELLDACIDEMQAGGEIDFLAGDDYDENSRFVSMTVNQET